MTRKRLTGIAAEPDGDQDRPPACRRHQAIAVDAFAIVVAVVVAE